MRPSNLTFEDARLIFRNFQGKEGRFNPAGKRNFAVVIPTQKEADALAEAGWNVKVLRPRDEADDPTYYIQVNVSFEYMPPKVIMITSLTGTKTSLDEDSIDILDWSEIENVDLTVRPYEWEVNGKTGIKGYLKSMYVTIEEDALDAKYNSDEY